MADVPTVAKATLQDVILATDKKQAETVGTAISVQFNPQSLKLNFSNQQSGTGQPGGSATQFVGRGVTKLSMELFFDVTSPDQNSAKQTDVRKLTQQVARYITPGAVAAGSKKKAPAPPAVRFLWGSFLFDGVLESMDETLDFFSSEGEPLRATVAITLVKQEITYGFDTAFEHGKSQKAAAAGTVPTVPARSGDTVQQAAARNGNVGAWKDIAKANDIENPRHVPPGTPMNLNPRSGLS